MMSESAGHILIVDDQESNRDLLSRRLAKNGCTFEIATGGEQARALLQNSKFDLVLLDIQMPRVSGLEILTEIRKKYALAQLPVILVTARSESRDVVEGLNAGANDYITKPIDFPVALARVRNQLALKRAETARCESEERYALAAAGARDGIWDWNLKTGVIHFSNRWAGMLGYTDAEIGSGLNFWMSKVHPEDRSTVRADLQAHIDGVHDHFENEHRILHKDGTYRWMLSRGLAVRDASNVAYRMAGSQSDHVREDH
jgi:PAS domain S-box-containing protein